MAEINWIAEELVNRAVVTGIGATGQHIFKDTQSAVRAYAATSCLSETTDVTSHTLVLTHSATQYATIKIDTNPRLTLEASDPGSGYPGVVLKAAECTLELDHTNQVIKLSPNGSVIGRFDTAGLDVTGGITTTAGCAITGQITATATPRVIARDATARAMANADYTDMIFSIEDLDVDGGYDNATGIYTVVTTGIYLVSWAVCSDIYGWDALEYWEAGVSKNNSTAAGNYFVGSQWQCEVGANRFASSAGCVPVSVVAGDTIRIKIYQNRGAATNTLDDSTYNYFAVTRLI